MSQESDMAGQRSPLMAAPTRCPQLGLEWNQFGMAWYGASVGDWKTEIPDRRRSWGPWVTRIGFQHAMHAARHAAAYLQRHLWDTSGSLIPIPIPTICMYEYIYVYTASPTSCSNRKCPPADWHVILIFIGILNKVSMACKSHSHGVFIPFFNTLAEGL